MDIDNIRSSYMIFERKLKELDVVIKFLE